MPGSAEAILNTIRSLGRAPADLARIIITHHHIDHTGSLAELVQQTHAQVLAHPADVPFITGQQARPAPRGFFMRLLFRLVPSMTRYTPVKVDATLQDGDKLDILGGAVVIHVPGHTPGSIALHFPAERMLIAGDTINRRGERLSLPIAYFTEDMPQAIASIGRMAALDYEVLCTGHGAPLTSGAAQQVRAFHQSKTTAST